MSVWTIVLILVGLLLLLKIFRRKGGSSVGRAGGFWRYHPRTKFQVKRALSPIMGLSPTKTASGQRDSKSAAVLVFNGDVLARGHTDFARMVDEVVLNKDKLSEVIVVVTSPGGGVAQYGRIFSEMERIRHAGLGLTVCVDTVAASGGYLMSLPANRIVAAPFAYVGSVGVVASVPNVRGALERLGIKPRTFTAGSHKRTVTMTDEDTPEVREHFQKSLEAIHRQFLAVVRKYRPDAKIDQVKTGDHWTAAESVEQGLGLVDQLGTSNEYLLETNKERNLVFLSQSEGMWSRGAGFLMTRLFDEIEGRLLKLDQPTTP